jgi:uncharacterized membrane protein SpoIIM required for sporulation
LYQRASADLAKINTFAAEPATRRYLEGLVGRAYGEINEVRDKAQSRALWEAAVRGFPEAFRRHLNAFWLALALTLGGSGFGAAAVLLDPAAKAVILPFSHLLGDPNERVAREEQATADRLAGAKATFSTTLMTHNIQVALLTLALGSTYGVGSIIVLFYNGVILGGVTADYAAAGQTRFLLGWLLPHGVIEIPAILIAGQAGLLLAKTLIGRGARKLLRSRLREVSPDLVLLALGAGLLLVWAGFVEAFLSQYHEPVIPYALKIGLGLAELTLLVLFLARAGRPASRPPPA